MKRILVILSMFLLATPMAAVARKDAASPTEVSGLNILEGLRLESGGKIVTYVVLQSQAPLQYEVVEHIEKRVVTVKLRNTKIANNLQAALYRDRQVRRSEIVAVSRNEYWVQILTKTKNMKFRVVPSPPGANILRLQFTGPPIIPEEKKPRYVRNILRGRHAEFERFVFTLNKRPQHEVEYFEDYAATIRLLDTDLPKGVRVPRVRSKLLKSVSTLQENGDLKLSLRPKSDEQPLSVKSYYYSKPPRLILDVSKANKTAYDKMIAEQKALAEAERAKEAEKSAVNLAVLERFNIAERFYRQGKLKSASEEFKKVYGMAPDEELGVRANFRAADSYFYIQRKDDRPAGYHFVINEYQNAINSGGRAGIEVADKARAHYNIAQSYHAMEFFDEAYLEYKKVLKEYPQSAYAQDALFNQGIIEFNRNKYPEAIKILEKFLTDYPNARLTPRALYKIGESHFHIGKKLEKGPERRKRFALAHKKFLKALAENPNYIKKDPQLMFTMGETYFENQEYAAARGIYEQLIDLYPNKTFSDMVAIRIGDFLRAEDKEDDAVLAYQKAINFYPKEVGLLGKMRIANIWANKPDGKSYKKAIRIYDNILAKHPLSPQVKEALLRKGLTQALFREYENSIKTLEEYSKRFPQDLYVTKKIIHDRILDNIRSNIMDHYEKEEYLEALGVYQRHFRKYLDPLPVRAPAFALADAYYRLGLRDKALDIYTNLEKKADDPLRPVVLFNKGKIQETDNRFAAQTTFKSILTEFGDHVLAPEVIKELADSYARNDQLRDAISTYKRIVKKYENPCKKTNTVGPDGIDVCVEYRKVCAVDKDACLLNSEIVPSAHFALGNLYQDLGQYDLAASRYASTLDSFNHAIDDEKVDPYIKDAHFLRGDMQNELERYPEAVKSYRKAIKLYPKTDKAPWAKYQIAQIYRKQGKDADALKIFEGLIEDAKKQPDALWGPLSTEAKKEIDGDENFKKYLTREASAKADGVGP